MRKLFALSLIASFLSIFSIVQPAMAAKPQGGAKPTPTPLGIDVSWPQCGKRLPTNHAFGIVGVNGGLATTTNPCLKEQLIWAEKAIGGTSQEKVQLYVNTANPIDDAPNTPTWPTSGNTPYGDCNGEDRDSIPCAWQYGWNRAYDDVHVHFTPAATAAQANTSPSHYIWWLDIETINSWKLGGSAFDHASNIAVLEGMTAYFNSANARVGLYSPSSHWTQITGNGVPNTSNLYNLPSWLPVGNANVSTAIAACGRTPLTGGGVVTLTQFVSKNLDYNYSCI